MENNTNINIKKRKLEINEIDSNNDSSKTNNIIHKKRKYNKKHNKQKQKQKQNWYNPNNKSRTKIKGLSTSNTTTTNLLLDSNIPLHTHKETIPKRVRELVWTTHNGETFTHKCFVSWCDNNINVFNFQVGHDIPESKGGTLHIDNLKPICGNCNLSMGNKYTITEWCKLIVKNKIEEIKIIL